MCWTCGQQGAATSPVQVGLPGYFHSWIDITFHDAYSRDFWLRTTIFSRVNVAQ